AFAAEFTRNGQSGTGVVSITSVDVALIMGGSTSQAGSPAIGAAVVAHPNASAAEKTSTTPTRGLPGSSRCPESERARRSEPFIAVSDVGNDRVSSRHQLVCHLTFALRTNQSQSRCDCTSLLVKNTAIVLPSPAR